jgi:alkanesulfonate monooxygenase SsuD/methylene tetrahydromethanopterin reductase-like flavin-dependent oxidoreductase (luciferase family)
VVGGNGRNRTLPLVARFADEWNGVYVTPDTYRSLNERLDELLAGEGRPSKDVRRSLMVGLIFGEDEDALHERLEERGRSAEEARENGMVVGTPGEVVEQLGAYAAAGAERVMLQWLDLDDLDGLAALAQEVLPQL